MPPTHPRKRHITTTQSNKLTSYFPSLPSSSTHTHTYPTTLDYANSAAYAGPTLSPPVPNEIQSSLLNVGMRVRKAVPEGYKNSLMGFKPKPLVSSGKQGVQMQVKGVGVEGGLVPFCGMHKVGGMAVQDVLEEQEMKPFPTFSFDGGLGGEDDENDFPLSSQESIMTTASTDSIPQRERVRVNSHKRGFSDEEDEDEQDAVLNLPLDVDMSVQRRMAKPRGVGAWARNVKRTVSGEAEMDFEDADFLLPMERGESMEL